jgi:hypothetical protein
MSVLTTMHSTIEFRHESRGARCGVLKINADAANRPLGASPDPSGSLRPSSPWWDNFRKSATTLWEPVVPLFVSVSDFFGSFESHQGQPLTIHCIFNRLVDRLKIC